MYLLKHHEYRINTESELKEGARAASDRQARKEDNDMLISLLPCVESSSVIRWTSCNPRYWQRPVCQHLSPLNSSMSRASKENKKASCPWLPTTETGAGQTQAKSKPDPAWDMHVSTHAGMKKKPTLAFFNHQSVGVTWVIPLQTAST